MIVFHTDEDKLHEAINNASRFVNSKSDYVPVVSITKLRSDSNKSFYGFHFEKKGKVKKGDIQRLDDLSIRRIEYVLS